MAGVFLTDIEEACVRAWQSCASRCSMRVVKQLILKIVNRHVRADERRTVWRCKTRSLLRGAMLQSHQLGNDDLILGSNSLQSISALLAQMGGDALHRTMDLRVNVFDRPTATLLG